MKILHRNSLCLAGLALLLCPALVHAHSGGPGHTHGFESGLAHPLTGLDHLCAMFAVGLWAAQRGGRALWLVPLTFVTVMGLGGWLATTGLQLPLVAQGAAASVFVLGVLIAAALRLPLAASAALVGFFAVFHGFAHGAETASSASGFTFAGGMMLTTAALHLSGIGIGLLVRQQTDTRLFRYAGGAIAAGGILFCLS